VFEDIFGDRESATLLYLPAELTWDNRDDALNPTTGTYMIGTVAPFVTLGDGDGRALTADVRGYLGFGEDDRTVLAGRAQAGVLFGGDIDLIPPDYLFYSGGSGTVRGQEYQSLGAIQNGVPSGGRSFGTLSAEVRQALGDGNLGLVLFADAGYVGTGCRVSGWRLARGRGIGHPL
jgi:translocation and assembly module TamA